MLARYSNQAEQTKRTGRTILLQARSWPKREPTEAPVPWRVSDLVSEAELNELVLAYAAGAIGRHLAQQFGLARSTVVDLLRERGVAVRHPRISQTDAALAVEMYASGMRQIDIAEQLGRSKSVIWHVLQRAGVFG